MPYYVISTFHNQESCKRISSEAVRKKLAACASMVDGFNSIYWWNEKVEETKETMVFYKVSDEKMKELVAFLEEKHEYDTPEIVSIKMDSVNEKYLKWIRASLQ